MSPWPHLPTYTRFRTFPTRRSCSTGWRLEAHRRWTLNMCKKFSLFGEDHRPPKTHTQTAQRSPSKWPTAPAVRGMADSCGALEMLGLAQLSPNPSSPQEHSTSDTCPYTSTRVC